MSELAETAGFGAPRTGETCVKRRRIGVELFATIALAVSLIVAATAVSLGVAGAQAGSEVRSGGGIPASAAAFLSTMMTGKIHMMTGKIH